MRRVASTIAPAMLCAWLASACNPSSLTGSDTGGDAGGDPGASGPVYSALSVTSGHWFGPNNLANASLATPSTLSPMVRRTLERTPGPWTLTATGEGSQPPVLDGLASTSCIRDQYVAAAMIGAYGTEYSARRATTDARYASQVSDYAATMTSSLQSAYSLCSNAPAVGSGNCSTLRFISCADLQAMLS